MRKLRVWFRIKSLITGLANRFSAMWLRIKIYCHSGAMVKHSLWIINYWKLLRKSEFTINYVSRKASSEDGSCSWILSWGANELPLKCSTFAKRRPKSNIFRLLFRSPTATIIFACRLCSRKISVIEQRNRKSSHRILIK